jgi:ABC-type branched-subunit amino acid transport system substrate-binding protein
MVTGAHPDVVYLGMYGPQAGAVVAAMSSTHVAAKCFVDLAAQGPDFVEGAGSGATGCLNSGVPSAAQLPGGSSYVTAYTAAFNQKPGTWGPFAYDSVLMLAASARAAGTWRASPLARKLQHTSRFVGATGTITIEPRSGNRVSPPVVILDVDSTGNYVIDHPWAQYAKYPLPS